MSTIKASTTSTTAYQVVADTTGTLVFQTGATPTTAMTLGSDQSITFAGAQTYTGGATFNSSISVQGITVGRGAGAVSTNTAVGASALAANTSGASGVAIGNSALLNNTTASNNTAVGYLAMSNNTTGTSNTGLGYAVAGSGSATTGAINNITAIGYAALSKTTGDNNTAVGRLASYNNSSGTSNVSVGDSALFNNTTASNNTAVGYQAGYAALGGGNNSYFGYQAGYANVSGTYNVGLGRATLAQATVATNCVAVGYFALGGILTGAANYNIAVGDSAGSTITTGSYNTYVGVSANPSSGSVSGELVVSADSSATGKGANTGFIKPGGSGVYQANNSASWSTTSDRRLKKNIVDNTVGLDAITSIRVRNFEYRLPEEVDAELKPADAVDKSGIQLGVIAQELNEVLPDCVKTESTGVMSVDPDNLTWYMVNAIKELKAELDTAKAQIAALQGASA